MRLCAAQIAAQTPPAVPCLSDDFTTLCYSIGKPVRDATQDCVLLLDIAIVDHLLGYCDPHCTGSAECRKPCPALLQAALVEYLDSCEVHGLATPSSMHTLLAKLMLELGGHHQVSR